MQRATDTTISGASRRADLLCVGIGFGDVLRIGDSDVWGREVNAASKLGEDTAKSVEILVTEPLAPLSLRQVDSLRDIGPGFSEDERNYRAVATT